LKITNVLRRYAVLMLLVLFANSCFAASWAPIRTSGPGKSGWQPLVCQTGKGWQSCEMPVNIVLVANPTSLVAIGETATITATVTDYYGVAIEGSTLNWTTTDGVLSTSQTKTDDKGVTSITLKSSSTLGGATVTAETLEKDGKTSIYVPFIDKFVAYPSTFTGFSNYGAVYSCTAWSPDPSTVATGTWFTQYANCWQTQIQYRQDREQSVVTGAIRNSGAPVALFQAIVVSVSQAAVGTMAVGPTCEYSPGVTEIWDTTDCRGGGGPHYIRVNGVYQNGGAQFINGRTGYMLGGVFYYRGAMMVWTTYSGCAGSEGSLKKYEVCRD